MALVVTVLSGNLRCQTRHLEMFRQVAPAKELYDLSANVLKRKRTELVNNALPCLTTSSQFWCLAKR